MDTSAGGSPSVNRKELKERKTSRTMTKSEYQRLFWSGCTSAEMLDFLINKGFINVE